MSTTWWSRRIAPTALALVAVILAGCEYDTPRSALNPAGPVAAAQLDLFMLTFWWGLFIYVIVAGILCWALWRYRYRADQAEQKGIPAQIHGNTLLEMGWGLLPVIILIIIGIPTVRLIFANESRVEPTEGDLVVNVIGYRWWWEFEYPELGIVTANELHVPVDRRVILNLNSADVLHSFWAPRLGGKRDLIPNQDNELWLEADAPGIYLGHCAEFCLTAHAYMRFRVIAEAEEDFERWVEAFQGNETQLVAQTVPDPLIEAGRELFMTKGCAGCHAIRGVAQGQMGPDLTNFGLRTSIAAAVLENTPENLAWWISDPDEVKPGNFMPDLFREGDPNADEQVAALVAYLESLGAETLQSATAEGETWQ